ncbi:MAG TPA: flagellar cap protein FliD N-terminal domain-containing protein, partial [Solirubrobacteraceae bacterium]|nr:flagellar cap protein FliD N-terminal domain-containing protein [Solirubrobacteraceae bacterium]
MSSLAVSSTAGSPISISGLASGLDTSSIISALMAAEREPVTRLTDAQEKLQGQQKELTSIQNNLQQLALAASEFSMPSLFESSQAVTSSEPTRVSAATSDGAGIGGYEVEVVQLANSAQRTFSFSTPTSEDKLTIDGVEFALKAGGS